MLLICCTYRALIPSHVGLITYVVYRLVHSYCRTATWHASIKHEVPHVQSRLLIMHNNYITLPRGQITNNTT